MEDIWYPEQRAVSAEVFVRTYIVGGEVRESEGQVRR